MFSILYSIQTKIKKLFSKVSIKFFNILINKSLLILALTGASFAGSVSALTFPLPQHDDVVGELQTTKVRKGESLGELGRRYNVGFYEMMEANPDLDPWLPPGGAVVVIPTQFILPKGPRVGIVLNLAEMRLYYYHGNSVTTIPVGIGKRHWSTPLGQTSIVRKQKDPTWYPPEGIKREHLEKGDILPSAVAPGPDNPLGRYAFYLGIKGVLIHGSNYSSGVGVRSSHGCIRCLPEDVETLFHMVPVGTQVRIVHEPFKVGIHKNRLYLEAHQPITDGRFTGSTSITSLYQAINAVAPKNHSINWGSAKWAAEKANGYPSRID